MSEAAGTRGAHTPQRIDSYLGLSLLGLAIGEVVASPVIRFIFFTGPLGDLRESAAPVAFSSAPPWGRALWAFLAFVTLLRGASQVRELQAGACAAGLAWLAVPFVMHAPADRVAATSLALQAVFGVLWAASGWKTANVRDRAGASLVGGLAIVLSLAGHIVSTRLRLGY